MKITIAFLLLSLSCCFTLPVDKKDEAPASVPKPVVKPEQKAPETEPKPVPKVPQSLPNPPQSAPKPVPKVPQSLPNPPQSAPKPVPKVPQSLPNPPQPAPKPVPKLDCLIQLLKKDAPALLKNLGTLLCNYKVAQNSQNVEYFMSFLEQVDNILKEVGCTLSNLLGTSVKIDAQDAANLANEVSMILFQFLQDIIANVMKILEEIPIIGDLISDVPLTQDVQDLACSVLNHYLTKIAHILTIVGDITGGLTKIIDGL
ncbi:uncharacterized protein ACNLHF_015834 isoform 1-T2 [Anomaloglossus baeobatrachus]|uniref:uncharacterized protein LOC142303358 n=1 Tax=Anomaloglossus baeobatrachus TaxID=238106 RepID=UPI003F4F428A